MLRHSVKHQSSTPRSPQECSVWTWSIAGGPRKCQRVRLSSAKGAEHSLHSSLIAVTHVAAVISATTGFDAQTEQAVADEKALRDAIVKDHLSDESLKTKAIEVIGKAGTTSINVSTNGQ